MGAQATLASAASGGYGFFEIGCGNDGFVLDGTENFIVYEIATADGPFTTVDAERTSFRIQFDCGAWLDAAGAMSSVLRGSSFGSPFPKAGNANQIVFGIGLTAGTVLETVRIESLFSDPGISDPDFIMTGLSGNGAVTFQNPEPGSLALTGPGIASGTRRRPPAVCRAAAGRCRNHAPAQPAA